MIDAQLPSPRTPYKRRGLCLASAALCLTLLSCGQAAPATDSVDSRPAPGAPISAEEVRQLAQAAMPSVREMVNQTGSGRACGGHTGVACSEEPFPKAGFNSAEEVELATVGTPAEMFLLSPQALRAFQPGQGLADLVTQVHAWYIPIEVNGEGRGVTNVYWTGAGWEASGYGWGTEVPANLAAVQRQYAQRAAPVKLVEVVMGTYLAWVTEGEQDLLIPLIAPPWSPSLQEKVMKPYPAAELLPELAKLAPECTPPGADC